MENIKLKRATMHTAALTKVIYRLTIVLVLSLIGTARAQLVANVTQRAVVKDTGFTSTSISSYGNSCTASYIYGRAGYPEAKIIFKRSNDGGHTWATQDPGLPNLIGENGLNLWKVYQLDSLNVISFGDSSLVLRTYDGGATWERQTVPVMCPRPLDMSFAGPNDGILIDAVHIFTTHDGGHTWTLAGFSPADAASCHAYGGKHFAVFRYSYGNIYSTIDDWQSVDSTAEIGLSQTPMRILGNCWFSNGDTMIAGGNTLIPVPNGNTRVHPLIVRSVDHGKSWSTVYEDTLHIRGTVFAMSNISRDTIMAGLSIGRSGVLVSSDRGTTWAYDTMLFPAADSNLLLAATYGIDLTEKGEVLATMGFLNTNLVTAHFATASVETYHGIKYYSYLYPNPTTEFVHVISEARLDPVIMYDILGREVLRDKLDSRGECKLDVSRTAPGLYVVMLQDGSQFLPVSRVVISH